MYRLTVWVKCVNRWHGSVSLGIWSQNRWFSRKTASSNLSRWSAISLVDTLLLSTADTIAVQLSAGSTELSGGRVLFNDITLELIR